MADKRSTPGGRPTRPHPPASNSRTLLSASRAVRADNSRTLRVVTRLARSLDVVAEVRTGYLRCAGKIPRAQVNGARVSRIVRGGVGRGGRACRGSFGAGWGGRARRGSFGEGRGGRVCRRVGRRAGGAGCRAFGADTGTAQRRSAGRRPPRPQGTTGARDPRGTYWGANYFAATTFTVTFAATSGCRRTETV